MSIINIRNLNTPYKTVEHKGIEYGVCRDYDHISRYKGLRQVVHSPDDIDRINALETANPIATNLTFNIYQVPTHEENRLDIVAYKMLGDSSYAWVIAYFNDIEDGFTLVPGQKLKVPKSITDLFANGEILQTVSPMSLNLGAE